MVSGRWLACAASAARLHCVDSLSGNEGHSVEGRSGGVAIGGLEATQALHAEHLEKTHAQYSQYVEFMREQHSQQVQDLMDHMARQFQVMELERRDREFEDGYMDMKDIN